MLETTAHLDRWCRNVDGLEKAADGTWRAPEIADVSYPGGSLELLFDVEPRSFWFRHRNRVIASVVRLFPPSGPIVDVGGGNGFVSMGLIEAGFPAFAVEPYPAGVKACVARGVPVVQAAFQNLGIPDASVDAIGLFDVLEHIEDDRGSLRELRRITRPGGMIYLAVPAYGFLWSSEDVRAGHFRRYATGPLAAKLAEAGFAPQFTTYFFSALVPPLFLLRTVPTMLGLGKRDVEFAPSDHDAPKGVVGRVFSQALDMEFARISRGRKVRFGTSCLAVARAV